jgi:hypothetical protein
MCSRLCSFVERPPRILRASVGRMFSKTRCECKRSIGLRTTVMYLTRSHRRIPGCNMLSMTMKSLRTARAPTYCQGVHNKAADEQRRCTYELACWL